MRKGGGKSKGASFERLVCKELSLWLSQGDQEDVLWRSAMSGGRSTVAHAKGKRMAAQAGDISSVHILGHLFIEKFFVECKNYSDLQLIGIFTDKGHLVKFWAEAKAQALRYKKLPMLVAKQNQYPTVVCLSREALGALNLKFECTLTAPKINLYVVKFDRFLKTALRPR